MIKGREVIIFVKCQPPFDVHQQYLDVSLIDLQAVEFFIVLLISRKSPRRLSSVFIFKKVSAHDFLAFKVIRKQAF